jgi:hypothetical protein
MHMLGSALLGIVILALAFTMNVNRSMKVHNKFVVYIAPIAVSATNSPTTNGVSTAGFDSIEFIVTVGAITGAAVFNLTLQDSSTNASDYANVAAAQIDSDIASNGTLLANTTYRIAYMGDNPYVAPKLTLVSGTSALISIVAQLGHPDQGPV